MIETYAKKILSAKNGMNIYRGCLHGCIYCDARSTCYQMNHKFEEVEVKVNAPQLLERELRSKRHRCMVGTGSMSDPYIPIEEGLRLTRQCLELIDEYGCGIAIQTKSDRILRDMDLLDKINRKTKAVVEITLTTFDEELCQILEPNVCTTKARAAVLKECQKRGIPTIVWMTPILPYINDTRENIEGLLNYCVDAGVHGIITFGMGVTLRDGDREYFYQKLDEHFPGMKERYIRTYGNAYELASPNNEELMQLVTETCRKNKMMYHPEECFAYMAEFEDKDACQQISLFEKM